MEEGNTQMLEEILETVRFLKDNGATKEELANLEFRFDGKLLKIDQKIDQVKQELRDEIISHVDGFIALHTKLDTEYASLHYKYDRLETRVEKLEQKRCP